jgi:hypothetical protein
MSLWTHAFLVIKSFEKTRMKRLDEQIVRGDVGDCGVHRRAEQCACKIGSTL